MDVKFPDFHHCSVATQKNVLVLRKYTLKCLESMQDMISTTSSPLSRKITRILDMEGEENDSTRGGRQILTLGISGPSSLLGTQPMPRDPEEPFSTHRIMPDNK